MSLDVYSLPYSASIWWSFTSRLVKGCSNAAINLADVSDSCYLCARCALNFVTLILPFANSLELLMNCCCDALFYFALAWVRGG